MLLFRYPPGSAAALLEGTLPLRYCARRFASKIPTWRLPARGHVSDPVTEGGEDVGVLRVEHGASALEPGFGGSGGVDYVRVPGGGVERVRLNRKRPRKARYFRDSVSATCLEETEGSGGAMRHVFLCKTGLELVGVIWGMRRPTSPRCA